MMFLKSLPNRYSYFLKKETNLYDWFISSIIYKNSKEVALKQIENALGILISENDSLRIRFSFENGELNEFIEESFIVNNYFDVNYIDGIEIKDVKENFEKRVEAYKREMQEYSELFKLFVLIDGRGGMYLYFLIHHLTCDLRSYIIIKNRFFELIDSQTIVDKVLYNKYVENIFNYWGKEKILKIIFMIFG
ncbi:condensation domain-containing protein [Acinetobacter sp. SAAs474]|uniref:condensation domain-containing protein n=1 Tax=Acinetobacter sp. SAAs474 TaxID=3036710 RepID=UPI002934A813|nr:condensation domain-containing protein [Acinetobacter sp. SAAs474]WOE37044.1 condensation domain-containing protein [Acinetobacter sp. SAAs474]